MFLITKPGARHDEHIPLFCAGNWEDAKKFMQEDTCNTTDETDKTEVKLIGADLTGKSNLLDNQYFHFYTKGRGECDIQQYYVFCFQVNTIFPRT